MGRQKLTETKVRRIKKLLLEGELTKTAIGEMYGVSRSQVCKIIKELQNQTTKMLVGVI